MRDSPLPVLAPPAAAAQALVPSVFLHLGRDRVYNPLTDRLLREGDAGYGELRQVLAGELGPETLPAGSAAELERGGWLVPSGLDEARRFLLKYVSLELHTVCNQSCYFCPVSVAPREPHFMPTEQFESIVGQLAAFAATIEGVALINYNEPTLDKRFLEQVRTIRQAGLPPAVLTNGSGLTPQRVDALLEMGGLSFLSINLSTLDRQRYSGERGGDHLEVVLRHLDYARDLPLAPQMEIVVLGTGDTTHRGDYEAIRERFAGSRFAVKRHGVMDRAGLLQIGARPPSPHKKLRGCENVGSRPLQHLHITPYAKCVLCCEDYYEKYVVGDLAVSTVAEVLAGDELARLRRWVYGVEEAPADFMCRKCIYARTR
ncbi:MAG TPA: radical SAM protein, partial [Thermoanaerobaculia bacterium]|nr:radical SAM protein [Thermoanaerobaculia bacterium]